MLSRPPLLRWNPNSEEPGGVALRHVDALCIKGLEQDLALLTGCADRTGPSSKTQDRRQSFDNLASLGRLAHRNHDKSDASVRTVVLPDFAIAVLRRRQGSTSENSSDAVFPTRNGTWQQVNNVERRWRQIRKDTGLDWVTPHTFRKTVATLISERVDSETAAQQLGHSSPAITRQFYISKPAIAADVAHVLEELADPGPGPGPNTSGISGE